MAPFPVDPSGGDGRGCARLGAGGTPALPWIVIGSMRTKSVLSISAQSSRQSATKSSGALACSRNTPLNTDHKSLTTSHYLQHPCFTPYELPRHMGGGGARGQTGVSQRVQVGFLRSRPAPTPHRISLRLAARLLRLPLKGGVIAWERGRPARILSLWPPLSFSAMLQAATLWAGTASARPKESHGAVPG